ncbi:MAG: histidinol-phosphate transaminase [Minisyncoccia bacterium]
MLPLDRNESYWMLDDELLQAANGFGTREFSTYPDYSELRDAVAAYAGVAREHILITPGSDAAIEHIARAYIGAGGKAMLPVPTFYGYESILERAEIEMLPLAYEERNNHFIFPLAATIEAMAENPGKMLFLCHPNNPLGCPIANGDISALVAAAREHNIVLVSDEAYFEFSSGTTLLPYGAELPNLIVLRTFSKAFALAGARVGYVIAAPKIIKCLERRMLPWPVAHSSVTAALALLARAEDVAVRREAVISAREHFIQTLQTIPGVVAYPSKTNFVLARVPNAVRVREALLEENIRVALGDSMSRFPDALKLLKDTVRIAVPAPESEAFVVNIFRKSPR